jgi:hypothetical protein
MSVREEVLSELETKLESLVDMFGKYMTSVVSEKSIKMDDEEKEVDDDDTCTEDDKEADSTDADADADDKENQKMIDEEKPKKSKK